MNPLDFLAGYKSIIAGCGLIGLSVWELSQGDYANAYIHFLAGLAIWGIRGAIARAK